MLGVDGKWARVEPESVNGITCKSWNYASPGGMIPSVMNEFDALENRTAHVEFEQPDGG